ncbi:MarR family winged helix-turn-helix transcriptional regulator [Macrococcus caseolyticus]|uniref:MarR family winged helix-turn-helix transcriptional regulator n=1 Tax=Macrococcoides caseolyticum TaxID=69966 RepID=UPI0011A96416|nr:MarR family winged helix-turn-helix transcriptional regulator [Macrococcus caseolyticus]MDJ1089558.1 MarR family winged helix-turn-helix transcriptional regulator [Macrococcus caseolyticus]MDJ1091738.1 MarR family winged helix-turn-helix transcriptional regulator [Macrococcus caseolyticus]MDJ1154169.1 MarR family winged helix-turn-helix transcriptional regulator [Macrococcus caseolyticus]MEB8171252.1 MarR family winged helix-turn-helix transcriptional regulator [Macrococcus caseolyticus]
MITLEQSIFKTASQVEHVLNAILLKRFGITFAEFLILYKVYKDSNSSVTDIQDDIQYKMDSASKKTKKLRDLGLVVKERRKDDERKVCVKITDSGCEIVKLVMEHQQRIYDSEENTFTKEDGETLFILLDKYRKAFHQYTDTIN